MQESLMLAVLSMDAYFNRAEGWQVGNAMINKPPADPVNGFGAYAYSWNGAEVIAFRGTDDLSDVLHGCLAGGGFESEQTFLAGKFYEDVVGKGNQYSANITLTGHSLGGGLAGLLGSLYGQQAVMFDNMAYAATDTSIYQDYGDSALNCLSQFLLLPTTIAPTKRPGNHRASERVR
jgi:Lipase (class 3)